jgi:hypothetical protein
MIATILVIIILESVLRIGAFAFNNWSRYYLFYGFQGLIGRVGISPWWTYDGNYYKFPPQYKLQGSAGQASETASINSQGFRGPEFNAFKRPDIFRIVCMGGSSTFGFHNNDDETYPFQLENLFKKNSIKNNKVEVINAGFPYYNTGSIKALLINEILDLNPDLVTLYTAYNDIDWPLKITPAFRMNLWLQQHSVIYLLLKKLINSDLLYYKLRFKIEKNLPISLNKDNYEKDLELKVQRYRSNLSEIMQICRKNDIKLILIKQPMTNNFLRSRKHFRTYEEEYKATLQDYKSENFNSQTDLLILVHYRLIKEMQRLAENNNIPIVDNIALVDDDRKRLASHVHLTQEANLKLAEQLHKTIKFLYH